MNTMSDYKEQEKIGRRLKAARLTRGISQWQLCQKIGLKSAKILAKYENGTFRIPEDLVRRFAKELGVTLEDVEETGKTFIENARIKAKAAYERTGMPCIADDSGLMVDALNGEPGVYSARYSGEGATDKKNIEKLLSKMEGVPLAQRTAKFVCAIYCILGNGKQLISYGECVGRIGFEPIGEGGFGYDPVDKYFSEVK